MLLLAIDAHYVQCGLVYSAVGIEKKIPLEIHEWTTEEQKSCPLWLRAPKKSSPWAGLN